MSIAMDRVSLLADAEAHRRRQIRDPAARAGRPQSQVNVWQRFFSQVRAVVLLLLIDTIVVFIVSHRNEINALSAQQASQPAPQIRSQSAPDSFRREALRHGHEVGKVAR